MLEAIKDALQSAMASKKFLVFMAAVLGLVASYMNDVISARELLAGALSSAAAWLAAQGLADIGKSAKLLEYEEADE